MLGNSIYAEYYIEYGNCSPGRMEQHGGKATATATTTATAKATKGKAARQDGQLQQ